MTQPTFFPMSQLDIAQAFLAHVEDECEKCLKAVISANKLLDAQKLRDMAEAELRRARLDSGDGAPEEYAAALKAGAEAAGLSVTFAAGGEEVVVCEPPADLTVDARAGEVTEAPATVATDVNVSCITCDGTGVLSNRTGGGHHRCKACAGRGHITQVRTVPAVGVYFPGDDFPTTVAVGPLTRFGELAADFLASLPADDERREDDYREYRVFSAADGGERDQGATIASIDHGRTFILDRADEVGSHD